MFQLEEIDPVFYRKQTRKSTLIIMAIFIVIGFITANLTVKWLGDYSNNHIVLNFLGAFVGLFITFGIVKLFFVDKPWMREALYAWRLKRRLMYIGNVKRQLEEALEQNDPNAMKVMRFYHLGLEQMHKLEDNHYALVDLEAEKNALAKTMQAHQVDLNQFEFDFAMADAFKE